MTELDEKYVLSKMRIKTFILHGYTGGIPSFSDCAISPDRVLLPRDEAERLVATLNSIAPVNTRYYIEDGQVLADVSFPVFLSGYTYSSSLESRIPGQLPFRKIGVAYEVSELIEKALLFNSFQHAEYTDDLIRRFRDGQGFTISRFSSFGVKENCE